MNRAPFLRAIIAAPDDDLPRLVYADYLEEHGESGRATFIRAQVEYAATAEDSPRRRELAWAARQLLDKHEKQWIAELRPKPAAWLWRRGFLDHVTLGGSQLDRAAMLFSAHPVRRLLVKGLRGTVTPLRRLGPGLVSLDLCGQLLSTAQLSRLAEMPVAAGLSELRLMFNRLDESAVGVLCDHPGFRGVKRFWCGANPLTEAGRERLRIRKGEAVSFACERDPDWIYRISKAEDRYPAGWGPDLTQCFFHTDASDPGEILLVRFDHAGTPVSVERRPLPVAAANEEFADAWTRELKLKKAELVMKRFRFGEYNGIRDFIPQAECRFEGSVPREGEDADDDRRWIERGDWVYEFGMVLTDYPPFSRHQIIMDHWIDRRGECIAS